MLSPAEVGRHAANAMSLAKSRQVRQLAPGAGVVRPLDAAQATPLPASGTGVNHWWHYSEEIVPGGGHLMVNVGTGNMLLQGDDLSIPHKGIALAFRRTYNSQSTHDVSGTDGGPPDLFGNGWTNTFDAHVHRTSTGYYSVYDVDGARYDYHVNGALTANVPLVSDTPGQHAQLIWDGGCDFLWTKKTGTTYDFFADRPGSGCPALNPVGAYAGRIHQIVGANTNTYITFGYQWLGTAALGDTPSQITATTESGMNATLTFASFSGHQLLQTLQAPDGSVVNYSYDGSGNLTDVDSPPNNASGTRVHRQFGYYASGSLTAMAWAASPRWYITNAGDGGYVAFIYAGGTAPGNADIWYIGHAGYVNPAPGDGTGSSLQPGYSTGITTFFQEYFTTAATNGTYRDSDGHYTNWVFDAQARPIQTQECTATMLQQYPDFACTGIFLVTNEAWDADNNLVSETDPRGNETDYAYDASGNAVAVGEPLTSTAQGTFKPTRLYDYDAFNNVKAYCDESTTHRAQADWPGTINGSDSQCSSQAGSFPHTLMTYAYQTYQPFGQLASITTPLGYTRHFTYAASQQAGNDYGLPTLITGDTITQFDNTLLAPQQSFWYDASGNLRCYSNGQGTNVLSYDTLGRLTSEADPDDSSANATSLCAKTSGQAGWNTQTTYTYFPDSSKQSSQTPAERALGQSSTFAYDYDGNMTDETHHHGCVVNQACSGGTTHKWYDGADRLVEVQQPHDPRDLYSFSWLTRYLYDLTAGGFVTSGNAPAIRGYGGLVKTQEYVPPGTVTWLESGSSVAAPQWRDIAATAYDAIDRAVRLYRSAGTQEVTKFYDAPSELGLLSQRCDALGECTNYDAYDAMGRATAISFNGSSTPSRTYSYDANGRSVSTSSSAGQITQSYDADGRESARTQIVAGAASASIAYHYYADGERSSLDVSGPKNWPGLLSYAYRSDGKPLTVKFLADAGATLYFGYTQAGRLTTRSDTTIGGTQTSSYNSYGLLAGMTGPTMSETAVQHDAEGGTTHELATYTCCKGTSPYSAAYTSRGELLASGNPSDVPINLDVFANGMRVPFAKSQQAPFRQTLTAENDFDPVLAISNGVHPGQQCPTSSGCSNTAKSYTYDLVGRLLSMTSTTTQSGSSDWSYGSAAAKTYDAEDHLLVHSTIIPLPKSQQYRYTQAGYVWGPNGHPFKIGVTSSTTSSAQDGPYPTDFQYDSLFWDGDTLLFTVNSAGQIDDVKIADLVDYTPGNGMITSWDRDVNRQVAGCHNQSGYAYMNLIVPRFGTSQCSQTTVPGFSYPATATLVGRGGILWSARSDGFTDGFDSFQGVRTYDLDVDQWNTPDAYRGTVHDPASQKPYMWNRNNPYEYSDPTGYQSDGHKLDQAAEDVLLSSSLSGMSKGILEKGIAELRAEYAAARAKVLSEQLGARRANATTTAITETKEGTTIVTHSDPGILRPQIRGSLRANEFGQPSGTGAGHAEMKGLDLAKVLGLTPTSVGASRPVCLTCQQVLKDLSIPWSPSKP